MSIERLKGGRWRVRWRDADGRQRAKNFPFREDARDYEVRLLSGTLGQAEMPRARTPTFAELAARWLVDVCDVMKAPSQRLKDRQRLESHLLEPWGELRVDHVTLEHGTKLRAELAAKRKPSTVNNVLKVARSIMVFAEDHGLVEKSPFAKLEQLPTPDQPFDYWMPDERDRFLAYARSSDPEFHDLAAVAVHSGLRLGELIGLRWDVVDLARARLMVRRTQCQHTGILHERTKNGKFREVPMNQVVLEVARRRRGLGKAGDQPVFEVAHPRNVAMKTRRMAKRAGVKPIRFHDLRHTFASLMAMAGVDLALLRELMGHSSYAQTLRYAHLHPSHLLGSTERLCTVMRIPRGDDAQISAIASL